MLVLRLINAAIMRRHWRISIVALAVLSMLLPGVDPISFTIEFVPLLALYAISYGLVILVERGAISQRSGRPSRLTLNVLLEMTMPRLLPLTLRLRLAEALPTLPSSPEIVQQRQAAAKQLDQQMQPLSADGLDCWPVATDKPKVRHADPESRA